MGLDSVELVMGWDGKTISAFRFPIRLLKR